LFRQVAADPELKTLAQRAFVSYVRSVSIQPNKDVFNVGAMNLDAYAEVRSGCDVIPVADSVVTALRVYACSQWGLQTPQRSS
jgi:hypothetical protein